MIAKVKEFCPPFIMKGKAVAGGRKLGTEVAQSAPMAIEYDDSAFRSGMDVNMVPGIAGDSYAPAQLVARLAPIWDAFVLGETCRSARDVKRRECSGRARGEQLPACQIDIDGHGIGLVLVVGTVNRSALGCGESFELLGSVVKLLGCFEP